MAAIDLYSGMGGWTLGFKMAGIPVLSSYEWWKDANQTHNRNFNTTHAEVNIRTLQLEDLPEKGSVEYVIGSPPCTQFSLSNRGGKGDIADGLVDIEKFLSVVEHMQPKYWAMENVPRVASILEAEIAEGGSLERFAPLFTGIKVYNSADFGVPQDRKRMIAGRLPFELLESYTKVTPRLNLEHVLNALNTTSEQVTDPIYNLSLSKGELTDNIPERPLSPEEERINRESKTHHPVYNRMSFPDRQNRPSRTITALCTRVSRESIIIKNAENKFRRLTVRERASIQSFPINYQLFGKTYANKIKMIGNAIPPLLTFYIAQSMLETPVDKLVLPRAIQPERLQLGKEKAVSNIPDNEGSNFSWNRSFWLAIEGLRFGSGIRFEFKNYNDKESRTTSWRVNFYYGNSKNIKKKELDKEIFDRALKAIEKVKNKKLMSALDNVMHFASDIDENGLQARWSNTNKIHIGPIEVIDQLANYAQNCKDILIEQAEVYDEPISNFIRSEFSDTDEKRPELKRLVERAFDIFTGICIGAYFNNTLQEKSTEGVSANMEEAIV